MIKKQTIRTYLCGVAMGAADVVPGISGGTIAFITGIYPQLVQAIHSIDKNFVLLLLKGKFKEAFQHISIGFLLPLVLGIATAIFSLAKFVVYLLASHPLIIWTFFFGLIMASVFLLYKSLPQKSLSIFIMLALGTAFAWYISLLNPVETPNNFFLTFLSGAIAICAMILPGISGSFLLVVLGKYEFILNAVVTFDILTLLTFCLGALTGILLFVRLLKFALENYYAITIALLTGFMLGSLRIVWENFPPLEMNSKLVVAFIFLAIGFMLPILLNILAGKKTVQE